MKQILFSFFLSILSLTSFAQVLPTFNLNVVNPDSCQYTLTGTYVAYTSNGESVGNIEFSPAGALDSYVGYIPSADSVHYVICGVMAPPCQGQNCTEGMLYMGPDGMFGSITLLIMNTMIDMDGDGYPANMDCDDTNPWAYPGAFEECNGIDNNCDGFNDMMPSISMYFVPDSIVTEENSIYVICQTSGVSVWDWQFGNGMTSTEPYPTNLYAGDGTYTFCLNVASMDGCTSDTCLTFTIDSTGWFPGGMPVAHTLYIVPDYIAQGVNEYSNNLLVYPNPIIDVINIVTPSSNGQVGIYSVDGKCVYISNYTSTLTRINTENLTVGNYVIIVRSNDGKVYTTKISK